MPDSHKQEGGHQPYALADPAEAAKLLGVNRTTLYSRMSTASGESPQQTKP